MNRLPADPVTGNEIGSSRPGPGPSASKGAGAAPLELRLLGPLEVRAHGQPLPPPRQRKVHWLLALLALRAGREVDREWLAGILWPDSAAAGALANLRRYLTELRAVLGDQAGRLRSVTRRTLCLDLAGARMDLADFEQALARGDAASLEAAVALYRGPLLEGCLEEWVFQEREARQQQYLQALQQLARHALARGEPAVAVPHLRRAAALDPLQESVQRALIEALAADGDFAAATQVYRDLRLLLHRELNAAPDPETTALFEQLRAEVHRRTSLPSMGSVGSAALRAVPVRASHTAPTAPTAPLIRLPRPLTRLVGREVAVREIQDCLATSRLVTLTGMGGIGKTRLAIEVAGVLAADYPDGVWFIDLAPVADPAQVPAAVARGLRMPADGCAAGADPLTEALLASLAPRRLLLVMDNCEHLAEASAGLATALLNGCQHLRLLATSRQPLGLAGEVAWRVPCLEVPPAPSALEGEAEERRSRLQGCPAVELFTERARCANPRFTLSIDSIDLVAGICRRLEGIPLALELAAAHTRGASLAEIAARLDDQYRLLTRGSPALPRHQTLRAAMDWSYRLLTEPERALLRRLAVFAGGFSLAAAEAVGAGPDAHESGGGGCADCGLSRLAVPNPQRAIRADEVLDLLTNLVDRSLVLFAEGLEPDGVAGRYRLLEAVREYAGEQLSQSGEERAVRRRHRDHFLRIAEELVDPLGEVEHLDDLDALAMDQDNLRTALAWSLKQEPEVGLRLALSLDWFWKWRSRLREGCDWVERFLACCPAVARDLRAAAYVRLGMWTEWQGDLAAAGEWYRQGLGEARAAGSAVETAAALCGLGMVCCQQNDYRQAVALLEESAALYERAGRDRYRLRVRTELGSSYHHLGDDERACAVLEECLALAPRLGEHRAAVQALDHLGDIACDRGDYPAARAFYSKKLAAARSWGLHELVVHALNDLGRVAWRTGDPPAAAAYVEEALGVAHQVGSPLLQTFCLNHRARLAYAEGDLERLRAVAGESLELAWRAGEMSRLIPALRRLAALAVARGEPVRAVRLLAAADQLEETHGPVNLFDECRFRAELLTLARAGLGEPAFLAAQAEHRALPVEQAVQDALQWAGSLAPP
jgi:predicted ATPase/DNA-binding SARP family transcriptional activator